MDCPECGADAGLGLCHACGYDARGEPEVEKEPTVSNTGPQPETPSGQTFLLPWDALASDNLKTRRAGGSEAEYRGKKEAAEARLLAQVGPERPLWPDEEVSVALYFHPPDRRRRDCSNLLKMLQDAGEGLLWADDYQIRRLYWERMDVSDDARCEMEVSVIENQP